MKSFAVPRFPQLLRLSVTAGSLVIAAGRCSTVLAATYEVAPNAPSASDDGPGSSERPWKTLNRAVEGLKAGDTLILRAGTYREGVQVKASGTPVKPIRIIAAPGERVVLTGADLLKDWAKADDTRPIYRAEWPHRFITWNANMAHPDDERHRLIGRAEQVFIAGFPLRQVLSRDALAPGAFFADVEAKQLYVWGSGNEDPTKAETEASARNIILEVKGDNVRLKGLRFRYAANRAQEGAVLLSGNRITMEDCVMEATNSIGGVFTGKDIVVRRCAFLDNGQLGFSAAGAHKLLFTECRVENNNLKNFDRGWEAGGNKLVMSRGVVLEKSAFLRNRGTGIWFDIGNERCTVRNCLIRDNDDAGIFYEISYGLHAHDNVIVGNGFAATQGAWGAQAGIVLSSSPGGVIERNLLVGNREGFAFREQGRTTPRIGVEGKEIPVWNHDQILRNNLFAYNQNAQVWGWFDINDDRHWPKGTPLNGSASAAKPGDLAAAYGAKTDAGQPVSLSLEALNFRFDDNAYYAAPGQGMLHWGTTWKRNVAYATPAAFGKDLGIERGGRVVAPRFADPDALDFRVPPGVKKVLGESYPKGAVPGVRLGVLPAPTVKKASK